MKHIYQLFSQNLAIYCNSQNLHDPVLPLGLYELCIILFQAPEQSLLIFHISVGVSVKSLALNKLVSETIKKLLMFKGDSVTGVRTESCTFQPLHFLFRMLEEAIRKEGRL